MKKFNRWLAVTVVLTTIVAPVGAAYGSTTNSSFTDLSQANSWAQHAIQQAQALGLMSGDPSGSFRPHDTMTRQELAVILSKALKLDTPAVSQSSFVDVTGSTWGRTYIEAVKEAGIMNGDGKGHFRPNDPISREELAVTLVKALGVPVQGKGNNLTVADKGSVSSWAKDYVQAAMETGLMKGDGVHFHPKNDATRQEIALVAVTFAGAMANTNQASVIDSVSDGSVTIQGVTYLVSDHVKGILNASNSEVLKGAKIKFSASQNVVDKITYLELTNSGQAAAAGDPEFRGDLVLDGNNCTIDGDVKIAADYISLKNLTVNGNFVIGQELQNDFYSSNLSVVGQTEVDGGAPNTVVFENDTLGPMNVNKQNVRVEPKGNTKVGDITVNSNAIITADSGVTIPKLTLTDGAQNVEINATVSTVDLSANTDTTISGSGNLGTVNVSGSGNVILSNTGEIGTLQVNNNSSKLTLDTATQIQNLVVPDGTKASDIIENYDQVKGQVSNVNGNQNPDRSTGSTGSSGSTARPVVPPTPPAPTEGTGTTSPGDGQTTQENSVRIVSATPDANATLSGNNLIFTVTVHYVSNFDSANVIAEIGNPNGAAEGIGEVSVSKGTGEVTIQNTFPLDAAELQRYQDATGKVYIAIGLMNQDQNFGSTWHSDQNFGYSLSIDFAGAVQAINDATDEVGMQSALYFYATTLGLELLPGSGSDYSELNTVGQEKVAQAMLSNKPATTNGYADVTAVKEAFDNAVRDEKSAESDALLALTHASNVTDTQSVLENYASGLGLRTDAESDYAKLNSSYKTAVAEDVLSQKPQGGYTDALAVEAELWSAVSANKDAEIQEAIQAINEAQDVQTTQNVLEAYAAILDLDMQESSNYANLSGKSNVAETVLQDKPAENGYTDATILKVVFDSGVSYEKRTEELAAQEAQAIADINETLKGNDAEATLTKLENPSTGLMNVTQDYIDEYFAELQHMSANGNEPLTQQKIQDVIDDVNSTHIQAAE